MVNNGYARCSKQCGQGALGGIHDQLSSLTDLTGCANCHLCRANS